MALLRSAGNDVPYVVAPKTALISLTPRYLNLLPRGKSKSDKSSTKEEKFKEGLTAQTVAMGQQETKARQAMMAGMLADPNYVNSPKYKEDVAALNYKHYNDLIRVENYQKRYLPWQEDVKERPSEIAIGSNYKPYDVGTGTVATNMMVQDYFHTNTFMNEGLGQKIQVPITVKHGSIDEFATSVFAGLGKDNKTRGYPTTYKITNPDGTKTEQFLRMIPLDNDSKKVMSFYEEVETVDEKNYPQAAQAADIFAQGILSNPELYAELKSNLYNRAVYDPMFFPLSEYPADRQKVFRERIKKEKNLPDAEKTIRKGAGGKLMVALDPNNNQDVSFYVNDLANSYMNKYKATKDIQKSKIQSLNELDFGKDKKGSEYANYDVAQATMSDAIQWVAPISTVLSSLDAEGQQTDQANALKGYLEEYNKMRAKYDFSKGLGEYRQFYNDMAAWVEKQPNAQEIAKIAALASRPATEKDLSQLEKELLFGMRIGEVLTGDARSKAKRDEMLKARYPLGVMRDIGSPAYFSVSPVTQAVLVMSRYEIGMSPKNTTIGKDLKLFPEVVGPGGASVDTRNMRGSYFEYPKMNIFGLTNPNNVRPSGDTPHHFGGRIVSTRSDWDKLTAIAFKEGELNASQVKIAENNGRPEKNKLNQYGVFFNAIEYSDEEYLASIEMRFSTNQQLKEKLVSAFWEMRMDNPDDDEVMLFYVGVDAGAAMESSLGTSLNQKVTKPVGEIFGEGANAYTPEQRTLDENTPVPTQ